ncbi:MAG: hypothetical protein AB7E53_11015, partial [Macellibacteroides sp.]|uniref:hypothetical protein n=1 Tax=Macellibacteroides sp. TaxID=2014584 RepID=UPI003E7E3ACF
SYSRFRDASTDQLVQRNSGPFIGYQVLIYISQLIRQADFPLVKSACCFSLFCIFVPNIKQKW